MPLTARGLLFWGRLQLSKISLSSSRLCTIVPNSHPSAALFALYTLIDLSHSPRCPCSQQTGGLSSFAHCWSHKRCGMTDISLMPISLLSTHSSWLRRLTSSSRNSLSWSNTTWLWNRTCTPSTILSSEPFSRTTKRSSQWNHWTKKTPTISSSDPRITKINFQTLQLQRDLIALLPP